MVSNWSAKPNFFIFKIYIYHMFTISTENIERMKLNFLLTEVNEIETKFRRENKIKNKFGSLKRLINLQQSYPRKKKRRGT